METTQSSISRDVQVGSVRVSEGLVLAPMAGATNTAFRLLCREYGAGLTITEMVSAKGLILGNSKTLHYLDHDPKEQPVGAQIFGDEPEYMAEAAKRIEQAGFHLVDVNMGCPVPKITDGGGGCSLMKEPEKAAALVSAMRKAVSIPVTVKIRAGWSDENKNAPEMARVLESAGACALTVHGRTREQKYSGKADWNLIGKVKQAVSIPVFGNGDVNSPQKAQELLQVSGCDGITIGRGALNSPWIFRDIQHLRKTGKPSTPPTREETGKMTLALASGLIELYGEKAAILMMRRYGADFSKGFTGGNLFRQELIKANNLQELSALIQRFFFDTADRETTVSELPVPFPN